MLCCVVSKEPNVPSHKRSSDSSCYDKRVQCSNWTVCHCNACCYKSTTRMARQRIANVTAATAWMSGCMMDCNWTHVSTIHGRHLCLVFNWDMLKHIQNTQWTNDRSNDGPLRLNCEWSSAHLCADDKANEVWASAAVIRSQSDTFRCWNKHYRLAQKEHTAVTVAFCKKSRTATLSSQQLEQLMRLSTAATLPYSMTHLWQPLLVVSTVTQTLLGGTQELPQTLYSHALPTPKERENTASPQCVL